MRGTGRRCVSRVVAAVGCRCAPWADTWVVGPFLHFLTTHWTSSRTGRFPVYCGPIHVDRPVASSCVGRSRPLRPPPLAPPPAPSRLLPPRRYSRPHRRRPLHPSRLSLHPSRPPLHPSRLPPSIASSPASPRQPALLIQVRSPLLHVLLHLISFSFPFFLHPLFYCYGSRQRRLLLPHQRRLLLLLLLLSHSHQRRLLLQVHQSSHFRSC